MWWTLRLEYGLIWEGSVYLGDLEVDVHPPPCPGSVTLSKLLPVDLIGLLFKVNELVNSCFFKF